MNPFEMVVAIIIVITIGKVLNTRYRAQHGIAEDKDGNALITRDPDAERLKEEVRYLKERVAVLEKRARESALLLCGV